MIPIGDSPRISITPWVNYALILVNVLVFLRVMGLSTQLPESRITQRQEAIEQANSICYGFNAAPTEADRFYCRWGFQPKEFFETARGESRAQEPNTRGVLLSILTSMFLHAGFLHIAGNMLFLFVFGDNIEDRLGHGRFAWFYLLCGCAAAFAQTALNPDSRVPMVGASGAIAGVMGAYLILFPHSRIVMLFPFPPIVFELPAVLFLVMWFAIQFLNGLGSLAMFGASQWSGGVAFWAHVAGFAAGVVLVAIMRRPERTTVEWWDTHTPTVDRRLL